LTIARAGAGGLEFRAEIATKPWALSSDAIMNPDK